MEQGDSLWGAYLLQPFNELCRSEDHLLTAPIRVLSHEIDQLQVGDMPTLILDQ